MKYLLIIGDGMADEPVAELGGKTPLQTAKKPTLDRLAAQGIIGAARNCPPPLPAGSETAILSIFGCDPLRYFTGRSPMEAAALGVPLREGDVCDKRRLQDRRGGPASSRTGRLLRLAPARTSGAQSRRPYLRYAAFDGGGARRRGDPRTRRDTFRTRHFAHAHRGAFCRAAGCAQLTGGLPNEISSYHRRRHGR